MSLNKNSFLGLHVFTVHVRFTQHIQKGMEKTATGA